jgi:hypothetical protein
MAAMTQSTCKEMLQVQVSLRQASGRYHHHTTTNTRRSSPATHLKVDGGGGDLLGVCLEAVAEVASVGQVQAHDALMRGQQRSVHVEVGGGAGEGLHVDAPLGGVQVEGLEGALLEGTETGGGG